MGRIKGTLIKRTTKELLKKNPGAFSEDFEHNKKEVGKYVEQKKIRNSIAGYISRLVKKSKQKK